MSRSRLIAWTLIAVLVGSGCGPAQETEDGASDGEKQPPAAEEPTNLTAANLKPYREVNRIVNERLLTTPGSLNLSDYFQDPPADDDFFAVFAPSLTDLLGGYNGDGLRNDLQNAAPNGVNLLLWYMALDGVSTELSKACVQDGETLRFALTDLRGDVTDLVKRLCAEADAGQVHDETITTLWQLVTRADAPSTELHSLQDFIQGGTLQGQAGHAVAHAALMAMLYNPHFLMQK